MKQAQFKIRKTSGFSLGELLVTVAILVILMAVALPSVIQIQKNMRQKELDAKAEIIYAAAQNAITKLKTSGRMAVYQYNDGNNGVGKINEIPNDADRDKDNIKDGDICYFTSAGMGVAADAIMDRDTVDEVLLNNHWVVEYNPSSAIIYAVFYSEDLADCAGEYLSDFNKYDFNLRYKSLRLDDGAKVGYYGGGSASNSTVTTMTPTLTIINTEKLAANISCVLPTSVSDYPVFKVDLKDGAGNTHTKYYAFWQCSSEYRGKIEEEAGGAGNVDYGSMKRSGRAFTMELILDDLSAANARFHKKYPDLEAGTALTVTVTAMCPGNYKYTQNLSDSKTTNSLFADGSTGDTAVISYGRHLQNLGESSGVAEAITKATQSGDITFTDEAPAVSSNQYIDWFETYHAGYFNGITVVVPNFEPIQNSKLQSYDGGLKSIAKLTAEVDSDAGLFATLGDGQTVSNVFLTGTKVRSTGTSTAAGALVGKVIGSAAIVQCQAYLTTSDIKGKDNHDVWIQGKIAGGLIGTVSGNGAVVTNSAASTVVGKHGVNAGTVQSYDSDSVGGLIGSVTGGSVTIKESYADCYLFGKTVGGLVGTSSGAVEVNSCYAAGFETFETEGAGLVCGGAKMRDSYTVVYPIDTDNSKPYYGTAENGTADHVYYLTDSHSGGDTLGTAIGEMVAGSLPSSSFTLDNTTVRPYNLMGQALSAYPYPVLKAIKLHYGDWMADFQEGTLVYYEEYGNGTYGFFGASVQSTLKDDAGLTVVGDGYGIVYQKGAGNLPAQITVKVKNGTSEIGTDTLQVSGGSPYSVTAADSKQYHIYPLSKDLVNMDQASEKYYLKAEIRSETQTDFYYFNPHFAMTQVGPLTDANAPVPDLTSDHHILVRTPRHLYMMSLYYDTYAAVTAKCTFLQERNIDYADYLWEEYSTRTDDKRSQAPIAGNETAFQATYDGGCHWITNVNFATADGLYVGFIGQNAGTIKNVVLTATYEEGNADNYHVRRSGNIENNRAVYMGILAGRNFGTIHNCAVSGYFIAGSDGTIHAYENSNLYAGGLVGGNAGTITNCSADTPALRLSSSYANAYLGGFAGTNSEYISNCYALGHIEVAFAKGGRISVSGFTGRNTDIIRDSYCAAALTASGEATTVYGFAPVGGQVSDCYYLNNGTYAYINHMYPFNFNPCAGTSATFAELRASDEGRRAVNCYNFQNTKTDIGQYPFRAVVQDGSGDLVHYGDWLDDENMGSVGIFYWEREEEGNNNGYHFTYLGTDGTGETAQMMGGTTLCNAHDDGGVITEYGYGYFELNKGSVTELQLEDAKIKNKTTLTSGEMATYYNQDASEALAKQMHKTLADGNVASYNFYAFTTGEGGLCLSGTRPNCTWTLTHKNTGEEIKKYTYTVSPFFANAMSSTDAEKVTAFDGKVTDYSRKPGVGGGEEDNQYEIRSIQQLQYINWNYAKNNTSTLVTHKDNNDDTYKQFTYLMYADKKIGANKPVQNKEDIAVGDVMHWRQTHDVDATGFEGYTPIAGNYESTKADNNNYSVNLYTWFGGNYDGQSYKIQNVSIQSNSYAVGLFGVTVGATIKNIIMYSDKNTAIKRGATEGDDYPDKAGAYALGGLIGVAYDYNVSNTDKTIQNCAIAGYQIVDGSTNQQGLGEANVGGLIGVANVHLKNCSAVVDIVLNCTPIKAAQWGVFIRVGGLTGAAQGTIENCYSGGSAVVSDEALAWNTQNTCPKYEIYIGGIAGSAFTSNYTNFTGEPKVIDGSPIIKNCYIYFNFPTAHSRIKAMYPIASMADRVGKEAASPEKKVTINNCYYLNSIKTNGVEEIYNGSNTNRTQGKPNPLNYAQMSGKELIDGTTIFEKLGSAFSQVTTTEGSANVPINGKYSFPGSNYALEGKNYPFPAVIQQKDLTFSTAKGDVYVFVHYGDWPIDGPYWTRGRDSLDIFADMQTVGTEKWAIKTFYLNPNGKNLSGISKAMFTSSSENIAEVMVVGEKDQNTHLYPVTIKAKNTGIAIITFKQEIDGVMYTAEFSLEVTANIDIQAKPTSIKLRESEHNSVELTAKSLTDEEVHLTANDYSVDPKTKWKMEVVEENSENLITLTQQTQHNKWDVRREGLGKLTLKADFEYTYNGVLVMANPSTVYIDATQPDTVGLSDGQNQYSVAYLGEDTAGKAVSYSTNKPSVEDGNFFLYLDAETLKIEELEIKRIDVTVEGRVAKEAEKQDAEGKVYKTPGEEPNFLIEWGTPTADKNYQYLPGSIYTTGPVDVQNVELKVTVATSGGTPNTLSVKLLEVKKALTITYQDSMETGAQSFAKQVSVGKHKLPTQAELPADFTIPAGKMLKGWNVVKEGVLIPEPVYKPGEAYDFTEDVMFTAVIKDAIVTLYADGGTFDGGETAKELMPDEDGNVILPSTPTRGSYAFKFWSTMADGTGDHYAENAVVHVADLAPNYTLYAQWEPYTLTLVKDGGSEVFTNVTGTSLPEYSGSMFTRESYTLLGWYTEEDSAGNRKKVLDENGKVTEAVSGYSKLDGENLVLELTKDQKLYARWYKPKRYVLTESLIDGNDYLLVSTNEAGEASATRVAFGPTVNPGPDLSKNANQDTNEPVKIMAGSPNYIEQEMPAYTVFHCSGGGKLKNSVGYLTVNRNSNGGINYQYELKNNGNITQWGYFGSGGTNPDYNRNTLYDKSVSETDLNLNPNINNNASKTKARRLSYMGRLTDSWAANAFAVKATKDPNTDMYIYVKEDAKDEFSTEIVPGSVMASMYSTRAVVTAESATLTLADGNRTVLSTAVPSGAAPAVGYTALTRINSEWTLEGWYMAKDETDTKILNADGTAAGSADVNTLALSGNTTLYACWMRETDIFVQTDTLEPDADYLLVLGSGEEAHAVGQIGETVVGQPVTVYGAGEGSYNVCDTESGDWLPIDRPYITTFSDQTVWRYSVDDEGNGMLTATDGSSRENALWELADSDISVYRRTVVRELSFEDEYLMLTLCTGTDCVTEAVTITDGAWTDAWSAVCQKLGLETGGLLGWFDSPDGGNAVLDAEGRFAAADVAGYLKDGKWIYNGGSLTLYARVRELPETEPMETMFLPLETEEDKKKRTPHKVRMDDMKA